MNDTLPVEDGVSSIVENDTGPDREADRFFRAWGEFDAHRKFIEASSKLRGVKEVVYDEEHLKQIVRDVVMHRPANVGIWIGHEEDGEVREKRINSSLILFQGLLRGADTPLFSEGEMNAALLQYEVDYAFGLTDKPLSEADNRLILSSNAAQPDRPLIVDIMDVRLDSPGINVTARNVADGFDQFDYQAEEEGGEACINDLDGRKSATFILREATGPGYTVNINKELPGEERVPGLDVQIGMLLLKQLGLSPEAAEDLGDMGPVYKEVRDVWTGDAF